MTEAYADPVEDVGSGVRVERRYLDGELHGIAWWHACGSYGDREDFMGVQPAWPDGWTVVSTVSLTLAPSILYQVCGRHGFIVGGKWVEA